MISDMVKIECNQFMCYHRFYAQAPYLEHMKNNHPGIELQEIIPKEPTHGHKKRKVERFIL